MNTLTRNPALLLMAILITLSSCHPKNILLLKSEQDMGIEVGTPLVMGFESVGQITKVTHKGKYHIYSVLLTQKLDLRSDAAIEARIPLMGDKLRLQILNRGNYWPLDSKDTLKISNDIAEGKLPKPATDPAGILRVIADSIDAHYRK